MRAAWGVWWVGVLCALCTTPTGGASRPGPWAVVREKSPLQLEATNRSLVAWHTPLAGFFTRLHSDPQPVIQPREWRLRIGGLTLRPIQLTYAQLIRMPTVAFDTVLECAGNGRSLQHPPATGIPWTRGAVGNARWEGVPLRTVLHKAGIKAGARYLTMRGADVPANTSAPLFIRSIPLAKALAANSILAFRMNGKPLPPQHGGPVRVVLPGWYGVDWMKWVTQLTLTARTDPGFYMRDQYRLPLQPLRVGTKWEQRKGRPVRRILVNSLIVSPLPQSTLSAHSSVTLRGHAFSGERNISRVMVSVDNQQSWHEAKLAAPESLAWQEFEYTFTTGRAGSEVAAFARATDTSGDEQPLVHTWNPPGYSIHPVNPVYWKVL